MGNFEIIVKQDYETAFNNNGFKVCEEVYGPDFVLWYNLFYYTLKLGRNA